MKDPTHILFSEFKLLHGQKYTTEPADTKVTALNFKLLSFFPSNLYNATQQTTVSLCSGDLCVIMGWSPQEQATLI